MAKDNKQAIWQNRIVGYAVKPARDFLANPFNFRIHTALQDRALAGSLDTLGWIDVTIENVQTGHLIDGHERVTLAMRKHEDTPVPFLKVDLNPDEEYQALLSLDPIAALAGTDAGKMEELLHLVNSDDERVQEMLSNLASKSAVLSPDFQEYDEDVENEVETITCPQCGHAFPK